MSKLTITYTYRGRRWPAGGSMIYGKQHPIRQIKLQLPGMRKPDECVVYPQLMGGKIHVQGARSIAAIDPATGEAWVNYKGSNPKYGIHLSPALGAVRHTFDMGFVLMCQELRPNSGDQIGPGAYVA
jgi:hypothetical protein